MGRLAELEIRIMNRIQLLEEEINKAKEQEKYASIHILIAMRDMLLDILNEKEE